MKNVLAAAAIVLATLSPAAFGQLVEGKFAFTPFNVNAPAGYTGLGVEAINDLGLIVGYEYTPTNIFQGFLRLPGGKVVPLQDPLDTAGTFTYAAGINDWGTVVGYYYDTVHNQYSGFFYEAGAFVTYNVPDLPQGSETDIFAINDLGDFCGDYRPAPQFTMVPYLNERGRVTPFVISGAIFSECLAINNLGWSAGVYEDSSFVYHGIIRSPTGHITAVDVPGSGAPGTVVNGLNDLGWVSGHFYDASGYEHGFMRSPRGTFYQIDAPGAAVNLVGGGTSGGGLNDFCTVVGHYDPAKSSVQMGYIAVSPRGCPNE
jgi:hypothetical protein